MVSRLIKSLVLLTLGASITSVTSTWFNDSRDSSYVNTGVSTPVQPTVIKPSPTPVIAQPKKVISAEDHKLCTTLDNKWNSGGATALSSYLDQSTDSQFLAYQNAARNVCKWHQAQIEASYNRYLSNRTTEGQDSFSGLPTGSAVIKSEGHDLYEWQRKERIKRDREQAAINWDNGSIDEVNIQREREAIQQDRENCPECRQGVTPEGYQNDTGVFVGK